MCTTALNPPPFLSLTLRQIEKGGKKTNTGHGPTCDQNGNKPSTTSQVASLTQKLHTSIDDKESSLNYQAIDS